jgi:hypothetical protein
VLQVFAGTVMNLSTTEDLHVACPFVHDQNNIGSATIEVYDRTINGAVTCQLFSEIDNSAGMTLFSSPVVSSGPLAIPPGAFALTGFGAVGTGNYNFAQCVIPKMDPSGPSGGVSHVAGFSITEN